jgi:hypothetical protein
MPTALGHDHQHACRQRQGLPDRIDEHVTAGGPCKHLHDLLPVRMALPATPPAKRRGVNAPVPRGGEGGKRLQRLGIGRVTITRFEQRESGEIAVYIHRLYHKASLSACNDLGLMEPMVSC